MQIFKKLLFLLGPNERKHATFVNNDLFMALLDMIEQHYFTILAVLTNPTL